jgi:ppGpp synthetase/RelA/SpoT-type nucleotidyltranferase
MALLPKVNIHVQVDVEQKQKRKRQRPRPGKHLTACAVVVLAVACTTGIHVLYDYTAGSAESSTSSNPLSFLLVEGLSPPTQRQIQIAPKRRTTIITQTHCSYSRSRQRTNTNARVSVQQWATTTAAANVQERDHTETETRETTAASKDKDNAKSKGNAKGDSSSSSALVGRNQQQQKLEAVSDPPPWLERYGEVTREEAKLEVEWLKYALREQGFSGPDILQVTQQLEAVADGDAALTFGTVDFLRVLLRLVVVGDDKNSRQQFTYSTGMDTSNAVDVGGDSHQQGFVSKQVLLASILHYAECITARREGLQDWIQDFLEKKKDARTTTQPFCSPYQQRLSGIGVTEASSQDGKVGDMSASRNSDCPEEVQVREPKSQSVVVNMPKKIVPALDDEVLQIAVGAARIKRAEILARAVVNVDSVLTDADASRLRGMLLSVMDDWRSLAIRCVACLYRLEGILHHTGVGSAEYMTRTPEMVQTAREAVRVYATLAQRLGMHRLKSAIEERAFRILYKRQYRAVMSLYRKNGEAMYSVSTSLLSKITQTLHQDESLMAQLEDLQVTSRVKEPFSFWKKLLKTKSKQQLSSNEPSNEPSSDGQTSSQSQHSTSFLMRSDPLAITGVQDAVALRVILKARKWKPEESDETTRARERILCYYVQHLIRSKWPALEADRFKDYIQFPKSNGYQSLHYTSSITLRGMDFPFEVQVRSDEMHRLAEFGVAAHWDYKLGSKSDPTTSLGNKSDPTSSLTVKQGGQSKTGLLLPPARTQDEASDSGLLPIAGMGEGAVPVGPYVDALVTAKRDMMQQTVYVFLAGETEGKLISLPTNSLVRDAITALDGQNAEGPDEPKLWLNGRTAYLDDSVVNGDVLLVT